jgi:hypothetical protein
VSNLSRWMRAFRNLTRSSLVSLPGWETSEGVREVLMADREGP